MPEAAEAAGRATGLAAGVDAVCAVATAAADTRRAARRTGFMGMDNSKVSRRVFLDGSLSGEARRWQHSIFPNLRPSTPRTRTCSFTPPTKACRRGPRVRGDHVTAKDGHPRVIVGYLWVIPSGNVLICLYCAFRRLTHGFRSRSSSSILLATCGLFPCGSFKYDCRRRIVSVFAGAVREHHGSGNRGGDDSGYESVSYTHLGPATSC